MLSESCTKIKTSHFFNMSRSSGTYPEMKLSQSKMHWKGKLEHYLPYFPKVHLPIELVILMFKQQQTFILQAVQMSKYQKNFSLLKILNLFC